MLAQGFNFVLRSFLNSDVEPTRVLDVNIDVYSSRDVLYREESLVLYGPSNSKKDKAHFEIVMNKPYTESLHQAYSLFRADVKEDAENKFVCLKDKVPILIDVCKEMANVHSLQKLCDILTEHPEWTLAHLAAHFGLNEAFDHSAVNSQLNSSDVLTGMSPLQVAISTNNLPTVKRMISAKCSLEHLDHEGNSVYHYAANTNKDIISMLTQGSTPRCMNARNHQGYTPLHIACLADKPECVKALLLGGADVNIAANCQNDCNTPPIPPGYVGNYLQDHPNVLSPQDMKFGGTPLHWSSSRLVIEELVDVKCDINALNFDKQTALHVMVIRKRLECVVALLSRQADLDMGDCDGNRPIHLAIQTGNIPIIQSLIVFGANLDVLNNKGQTPRHMMTREQENKLLYYLHAVGAARCPPDMVDCTDGCKANGTFNGIPLPDVMGPTNRDILNQMLSVAALDIAAHRKPEGSKGRLLSLDGGGIRGLVLIQMLLAIEQATGKPLNHCFDWVAGTSTGGILALGIASGKNMRECLCLYFRMKELTFVGIRPYPSEALENVLKDTFGTKTVMTDIKYPKVLVTGVLADRKPVDLHLFRNYQSASDLLDIKVEGPYQNPAKPDEQLVWEVGRATGAAPTYFRAFGRFLDGGLIANNPTLDALTEIHELNLALRAVGRKDEVTNLSAVVSLGTGLIPVTELKVDVYRPERLWDSVKMVVGISALGGLLVDQATASDGRVVDRARAWCSSIGVPYFRFTPQMSEDISMDEKSDEKLVKMLWETKSYMHENQHVIRELANLLTN
ncbi:PREDICTED: 85/88 kDa calcium-independent phospholipase A2 [Nicrophorus vespilloides]|uniref:phospholipase A2 n=1 Tax=Nicrophorus vespilloides TaxID=110193 RepID=A0ABM1MFF2_NICVS|nr:PREDICTED: 85/88 kDa calcium-independent phospholipase A2 [Nicrophorus vespilloides]